MKNMKRAYRRHKKQVKFIRRINKWFAGWDGEDKQNALCGKSFTFLRTTGNPCNCFMCSGENKYKREPRFKWHKEIKKQIEDENEIK